MHVKLNCMGFSLLMFNLAVEPKQWEEKAEFSAFWLFAVCDPLSFVGCTEIGASIQQEERERKEAEIQERIEKMKAELWSQVSYFILLSLKLWWFFGIINKQLRGYGNKAVINFCSFLVHIFECTYFCVRIFPQFQISTKPTLNPQQILPLARKQPLKHARVIG